MKSIFDYKDNLHAMDHIPAILKWGKIDGPKPEVSILMPVYNHPQFFKLALETAINQDYEGLYEIVVLDNNQDDDVNNINEFEKYIIEKKCPKVLYYKNEHNIDGINSYNRLPQLARADYFTFLHDDDELCVNCLSELMSVKNSKGLVRELVVPSSISIDKDSKEIYNKRKINGRNLWGKDYIMTLFDWFLLSYTNGGGVLHHRESFIELGGYCPDYIPSADYAFYILYVSKFGAYFRNKELFRYRWAENDSMMVYEKCTERDRQFRTDMMSRISLPNCLLQKTINAGYNARLKYSDERFKGSTNRKLSVSDKFTLKFMLFLKLIRHLK